LREVFIDNEENPKKPTFSKNKFNRKMGTGLVILIHVVLTDNNSNGCRKGEGEVQERHNT